MGNLSTATITGKNGPGDTVTSLLLEEVSKIEFDFARSVARVTYNDLSVKTFSVSLTGINTVTFTITDNVADVVIST